MKEITINNKQRKIFATVGGVKKIIHKYDDLDFMKEWTQEKILTFSSEIVWKFLKKNCIGLKPYLFFRRFVNQVDIADIRNAQPVILSLLYGVELQEDKERKNGLTQKN